MVPAINHLSLCTGYGGIDLGLAAVLPGLRTVCYVEREAFAIANLGASMEAGSLHSAPIWDDLQTFDGTPWRGIVDILSGGVPCQPFSIAGKRLADDDPRHLWPQITRIIDECRPRVVFLENVEGIISAKLGGEPESSVLWHVLQGLEALGYRATAGIYSAEECGAPHRRKRVFIAGVADARLHDAAARGERATTAAGRGSGDGQSRSGRDARPGHRTPAGEVAGVEAALREVAERSCVLGWCPRTEQRIEDCDECTDEELRHRLGDTDSRRLGQGNTQIHDGSVLGTRGKDGHGGQGGEGLGWPARPGEQQHDWEPPRTVEPGLGGSTDAGKIRHRVDRLRLLGNGCVPQTVALAFMDLMGQLLNE